MVLPQHTTSSEIASNNFLDLKTLSGRTCLKKKAFYKYIKDPSNPLPHYRMNGGKILVKWGDWLQWVEQFKVKNNINLDATVKDILNGLKK